jgi:hypothetical protein
MPGNRRDQQEGEEPAGKGEGGVAGDTDHDARDGRASGAGDRDEHIDGALRLGSGFECGRIDDEGGAADQAEVLAEPQ